MHIWQRIAADRRLMRLAAAIAMLCLCGAVNAAYGAEERRYDLDIPSQSLGASLRNVALASHNWLLYKSELVADKPGVALHGQYTMREALDALLRDTGLSFRIVPPGVILIRSVPRAPMPAPLVAGPKSAAPVDHPAPALLPGAQADVTLEEVVITARRRTEVLQRVPISIAVFNAAQLQSRGIETTESLNRNIANVAIASGNFFGREQGSFRMRGLPDIGIYVDGIAHQETFGILGNVVEMERVEVLRGPQGTLFGKGSLGGAIQYVTRKPADTFGVRVKLNTGSFNRVDVTAVADIPLAPTLLTKVTLAKLSSDGYLPSVSVPQSFGSQDDTVARLDILWKPTERFNWQWALSEEDIRTNGVPSTVWRLDPVCTPVANLACLYNAVGLTIPQSWVYGRSRQWLTASGYLGPELFTDASGLSTQAEYMLGSGWSLKGLGSYRNIHSVAYDDFDGIPYKLFDGKNYNTVAETTGELQLQYSAGRLNGTTGLYSYKDYHRFHRSNWLQNELRTNPVYNAAALAYLGLTALPPPADVDSLTYTDTSGWATFAEWTYKATERFSVTAGIRYNSDDIAAAVYRNRYPQPPLCCEPVLSVENDGSGPTSVVRGKFTNTAPRVSLQYQWNPVVMSYFTYAEGFNRGGGTQTANGVISYEPEEVRNYEIGLRSDLFERQLRLNASLFYSQYRDVQITQDVNLFNVIVNAGRGQARGLELEGQWLFSHAFSMNYGVGYLDTKYSGVPAGPSAILNGRVFPFAPRLSLNLGIQHQRQFANGSGLLLRADYGWQDDIYTGADDSRSFIPAYGLLGARVSYVAPGGRWELALHGSNLLNAYYRINGYTIEPLGLDNGTLGRPREWGVTLNYRFD